MDSKLGQAPYVTLPDVTVTKNNGVLVARCSRADIVEELYAVLKITQNTPTKPIGINKFNAARNITVDTGGKGAEVRNVPWASFMELESHREPFGAAKSNLAAGVSYAEIPFEIHFEQVKALEAERTVMNAKDLSTFEVRLELPAELDNVFIANAGASGQEYTLEIRRKITPEINDVAGANLVDENGDTVPNPFSEHTTDRRILSGQTKTTAEKIMLDVDQATREIQFLTWDTTGVARVRSDNVIGKLEWRVDGNLEADISFADLQNEGKTSNGLARIDKGDHNDKFVSSFGANSSSIAITLSPNVPASFEIEVLQDGSVINENLTA